MAVTLNGILARLRTNANGYVYDLGWFLILVGVTAVADAASTVAFMLLDGADQEAHPVIRLVSRLLGPVAGPIAGKGLQFTAVVLVTLYWRRWAKTILVATAAMYAWGTWYNLWGKYLYTPWLVRLLSSW